MAVNPPEELDLDGLTVRRLSLVDADDLLAHFSDPQVTEFLDFSTLRSRGEADGKRPPRPPPAGSTRWSHGRGLSAAGR